MVDTDALTADTALGHHKPVNVFLVSHNLFSPKAHCIIIKNHDLYCNAVLELLILRHNLSLITNYKGKIRM